MARPVGKLVNPSSGRLCPLGVDEVRLAPGFWGDRQRLNSEVILGHCLSWMDRLGWIGNFRGRPHRGREFSDSEVYKLLEAMCWEAGRAGREDDRIADLTQVIAGAQEPDGYLNTRFGGSRYTDLEWGHELYCYGHLLQAAVARLRTHGDDELVQVARRAADHVGAVFGPRGHAGVCGHPEIEMALVELYRATGVERYLEQARLFVERRGRPALADIGLGRSYFQDDMPVRAAQVFRGHAVRALYLACGAVDVAVETGDDDLLSAVIGQWERTIDARTYLTGGMGSRHTGEAFGDDFELPPDRAYAETCAGVASVMLAWRLLLATGDVRYADFAERALFNVVAAAPASDGRAFFYTNPLHVRSLGTPPAPGVESPRAAGTLRAPWFAVSCCPTNIARTFAGLAGYVATSDDHGVQIHQFASGTINTTLPDGRAVGLRVETDYPWSGSVTVRAETGGTWRLSLRVPSWAGADVAVPGEVHDGYTIVEREWRPGEEIRLELPMRPRWTWPDPRIDAVRGCVAAERGPLVYCAESPGDEPSLSRIAADTSILPAAHTAEDVVLLTVSVRPMTVAASGWPYLPGRKPATGVGEPLALVPYHRWGNRGPATMRVWLPVAGALLT